MFVDATPPARTRMAKKTKHLVSVWNPSYAADAMSDTVALLQSLARDYRGKRTEEEDVHVWWGKVKSSNRQQPLIHLDDILALDDDLSPEEGATREMHLYLTDYRSLYVGHVAGITVDDVSTDEDEQRHVPAYYRKAKLSCDCWFELFDIRRVIADDTIAVVKELQQLRNTRYHDRPVSIYGGMVELPLIVTRDDDARYFESDVRDKLIDGRFWVEFDAELTGMGELQRELRDNVVGEAAWDALDPAVRIFVATAESLYRAHRKDPAFDFSAVVIDFAEGDRIAGQPATTPRPEGSAARCSPCEHRRSHRRPRKRRARPLGALARAIGETADVNRALKARLAHGEWFTASLPPILRQLSDLRNPAAHTTAVSADEARKLRDRILGVGVPSILAELGRVRPL